MRTETITTNIYTYDELSDKAKAKARNTVGIAADWFEPVYEDARQVGIAIMEFDIVGGLHCRISDGFCATETADLIIENHGKDCDTYKEATAFASVNGSDIARATFKAALERCYAKQLREQLDYCYSDDHAVDMIECNDFEFLEDGSRY